MPTLHRIVLTGGPCGGKTTATSRISERLESLGFRVFLVPEAATLFINGGISFQGITPSQLLSLEGALLRIQIAMEDAFVVAAEASGVNSVVIYDRGMMDISAYLPKDLWQALLDENGHSLVGLRDRRYDAVIHLVTAADGAESFYTTANNAARKETPSQAKELDRALKDAWVGHPHLRVIGNSGDFAQKMHEVLQAVCRVTGIPEPVEVERKFLLKKLPQTMPVRAEELEVEQTYLLTSDGSEARVRRRGQRGSYVYSHTTKRPLSAGQRVELERPISAREYVALLSQADPSRRTIRKRRTCFLWESQYFEIDHFLDPKPGLALLEAELDDEKRALILPPFLEIEREVTEEPAFSNYHLASKES